MSTHKISTFIVKNSSGVVVLALGITDNYDTITEKIPGTEIEISGEAKDYLGLIEQGFYGEIIEKEVSFDDGVHTMTTGEGFMALRNNGYKHLIDEFASSNMSFEEFVESNKLEIK